VVSRTPIYGTIVLPDPRFKADILVVVAHPDDEIMAAAYLARKIYDDHKSVAVVFQTPGDGGTAGWHLSRPVVCRRHSGDDFAD
jgi:LmbE family N-acetylglucosaminyl deacetylase